MLSNENADAKCLIETNGRVNCSTSIYEDEKKWKKSRAQVDLLIQTLKNKIVELKDIRRHLKENKPKNMTDDNMEFNESSSQSISFEDSTSLILDDKQPKQKLNGTGKKQPHRAHKIVSTTSDYFDIITSAVSTSTFSSIAPSMKPVLMNQTRKGQTNGEHIRRSTTKIPRANASTTMRTKGTTEAAAAARGSESTIGDSATATSELKNAITEMSPTPSEDPQLRTECYCEPDTNQE